MSRNSEQKIRLLVLYDILQRQSDEEHSISTKELIDELAAHGINTTRQTIYEDINILNSFGYEIICVHGRNNRYFVGDRNFELPEIQILLHAMGAAKFLTEKKSSILTEKVAGLLGEARANELKSLLITDCCGHGNERIYYNIDAITAALLEKRKLSFWYFDYDADGNKVYRRKGERYEVNPLGMVYSGENFYLVCYQDKYSEPASYRIDKIDGAQAEDSEITDKTEFETFDLRAYKRETFGMFYGAKEEVVLYFPSELADVVRARFGAIQPKINGDGRIVNVPVRVSRTFYAWITTFEGKVKILEPQRVKDGYKEFIENLYNSLR